MEYFQGTNPTNGASSSASLGLAIVDGVLESAYGSPLAVQTVNTSGGDNLDELNAAYALIQNDYLYLMLTGNMNTNVNMDNSWNHIEIFIDASDAITNNVLDAAGGDNTDNLDGMVFDNTFTPDYHINLRAGEWAGNIDCNIDFVNLKTVETSYHNNLFNGSGEGTGYMGAGDASSSIISVGVNNSNTAGIVSGITAADTAAATAVTTGIEIAIALADLAQPYGELKIMAMVTSNDHQFISNQILAGLGASQGALGVASSVDFSQEAGDQYFSITRPYPALSLAGHTLTSSSIMQLNLTGFIPDGIYEVHHSDDLRSAFVAMSGSEFTVTNDGSSAHEGLIFGEAFGGAVYTNNQYRVPVGVASYAGFANSDTAIYPLIMEEGATITFEAEKMSTEDIMGYVKFERLPYDASDPSATEPSHTASFTITGTGVNTYTINVPPQALNTYSSLILYLNAENSAGVVENEVTITNFAINGLSYTAPMENTTAFRAMEAVMRVEIPIDASVESQGFYKVVTP